MASCPHCSQALDGFLDQETHRARLKEKDAANKLLSDAIAAAQAELTALAPLKAERDAAVTALKKTERTMLLNAKGITDPQVIASMEVLHAAAVSGAEEPAAFEDFEGWGATSHPLLRSVFPAPVDPAAPVVPGAPAPRPILPTADPTAKTPPPAGAKMSPTQLAAHLQSPEFKSKSTDDQRAEIARLKSELA